MTTAGVLYIISAPSGAGKTSLINELVGALDNIQVSVSHTTRPKREGEMPGIAYHFVDDEKFKEMIAENAFLEYANVYGYHYGTSKIWMEQKLASGTDVILEIDWQGAQQIRQQFPQAVSIFILPPSIEILRERLLERSLDTKKVIDKRLQQATEDISHYEEYDYIIINDDFIAALSDLRAVVRAQRCLNKVQIARYKELIAKLVKNIK